MLVPFSSAEIEEERMHGKLGQSLVGVAILVLVGGFPAGWHVAGQAKDDQIAGMAEEIRAVEQRLSVVEAASLAMQEGGSFEISCNEGDIEASIDQNTSTNSYTIKWSYSPNLVFTRPAVFRECTSTAGGVTSGNATGGMLYITMLDPNETQIIAGGCATIEIDGGSADTSVLSACDGDQVDRSGNNGIIGFRIEGSHLYETRVSSITKPQGFSDAVVQVMVAPDDGPTVVVLID